ncbi:hypothetical protein A3F00_01185 [Candidatus Daviesbacteria bacterium RIFCSPHIGHO2_12_FULL_37_11]|uniref:Uncharacterized protein n=1 Tax=Candidatus Daviesbacteria bacterium RIFCSPHIGHO2_12_FULL_37_11 TaxID=1797777 RepID=A0A1F5K9K0_9BACT|nr:MAG: hypothetical protein A3F00_01185 [Candidatus Daviesbacteria bacterium RIFCSPHIGHO2_12_FULL_37_11]OGE45198.1 MAG: hypothetical protein A3B39_01790 [Candidatus Daviesbacteria bacterium RIFCSPLOWO2_01_FULL_37_10]
MRIQLTEEPGTWTVTLKNIGTKSARDITYDLLIFMLIWPDKIGSRYIVPRKIGILTDSLKTSSSIRQFRTKNR